MSLPLSRPARPETHKPYDLGRLVSLAGELDEALAGADADALTPELVEEIAADLGASEGQIYAAAATLTEIPCDVSAPVRFELCMGGCQGWGAGEILEHLITKHVQRRDEGGAFGIVAKRCLDQCARAPFVLLHTKNGTAALPEATPASIDEALDVIDQS